MRSLNGRKTPAHGFTLVELLVVIGIISILVAILLPALNKAREQAKTIQCASNMKQVMLGVMMYAQDYKGYIPPVYTRGKAPADTTKYFWPGLVGGAGYVKDPRAFFCPTMSSMEKTPDQLAQLIKSPAVNSGYWAYVSYGLSRHCVSVYLDDNGSSDAVSYGTHSVRIGQPGITAPLLGVLYETFNPSDTGGRWGWYASSALPSNTTWPWTHPGGVTNVAYLDGHVGTEQASVLGWDPKKLAVSNLKGVQYGGWMTKPGGTTQSLFRVGPPWYIFVYTKS